MIIIKRAKKKILTSSFSSATKKDWNCGFLGCVSSSDCERNKQVATPCCKSEVQLLDFLDFGSNNENKKPPCYFFVISKGGFFD